MLLVVMSVVLSAVVMGLILFNITLNRDIYEVSKQLEEDLPHVFSSFIELNTLEVGIRFLKGEI